MRVALVLAWVLCAPAFADSYPYPARTADDRRIDWEIGDANGWVDEQEAEVARATYDVYRTTRMVIQPKLAWLRGGLGGMATHDARGPVIYIHRGESVRVIRFVVFHEAGHVAHGHHRSGIHGSVVNGELWATEYAGRLIAATHGDILAAIIDAYGRQSPNHGSPNQRARAMWRGYWAAGGRELLTPAQKEKLRNLTPAQREQLRSALTPQQREKLRRLVARLEDVRAARDARRGRRAKHK